MKFHVTRAGSRNLFTGYGEGYVSINERRFEENLLVAPEGNVATWAARSFDTLSPAHFESILELKPELVLLGTGSRQRFPHPALIAPLARSGVGFEAMDTRAACRTYNILMDEGRQVVAAILIERSERPV